jgi:hypothetical protein
MSRTQVILDAPSVAIFRKRFGVRAPDDTLPSIARFWSDQGAAFLFDAAGRKKPKRFNVMHSQDCTNGTVGGGN